jgi:hypothetical protein
LKTLLIRIDEPADGPYPVTLYIDDGGDDWLERPQAKATIPCPLPDPGLAQLDLTDGTTATEAIRKLFLAQNPRSEAFAPVGVFLHGLVTGTDIKRKLQDARDAAGREGVRLLLEVRARELRELPWELMMPRDSSLPLFLDERNPCARVYEMRRSSVSHDSPDRCPILRVLVVVGAKPEDEKVEAARELENLRDGFRTLWGLVDVEVLHQPPQKKLERCYEEFKPHILHFIGHGRATDAGGVLDFDGRDGGDGWSWTTRAIAATLATWQPRLAFVNACRSGTRRSVEGTWQVADALLGAGVPAVLGILGDIRGDTAAEFTGALYGALAARRSLGVAVVEARRAAARLVDDRHRDPWLPSLWLSTVSEPVLLPRYAVTPLQRTLIERTPDFAAMRQFVNRTDERRSLWRSLWRSPNSDETTRRVGAAVTVVGPAHVGKSALVKWTLGLWALHGANVAYVDLDRHGSLDFVGVLTAIKDTLGDSPLHGEANQDAFKTFKPIKPGDGNTPEDAVDTVFRDFEEALRRAAGEKILLLGLDHIGKVQSAHWRYVLDKLVVPVARGTLPVRLIIVGGEDVEDTELGDMRTVIHPISLDRFPRADFDELARRYLRAQYSAGADDVKKFVDGYADLLRDSESWTGDQFEQLDRFIRGRWQREAA